MQILWSSALSDTPTSIEWLGESRFLSGFTNKNSLGVYDLERGDALWEYGFDSQGECGQANKVQVSGRQHLIGAAHEDHTIRFYDPNSSRFAVS